VQSYLDMFLILMAVAAVVVPVALLLPKLPKGAAVGGH
jgi:hypothetical protein